MMERALDESLPTSSGAMLEPRHRWFHVKEAFSPRLLDEAFGKHIDSSCRILEPFSGSGTIPVSAAEKGVPCKAYEVNPFLHFVSQTKLATIHPKALKEAAGVIEEALKKRQASPLASYSTFSEGGGAAAWLFNTSVLEAFESGWQACECYSGGVRDLLNLSLLGAAMENCNAKRDGKCLRYRPDWQNLGYNSATFADSFLTRIAWMVEDLEACPLPNQKSTVRRADVRLAIKSNRGLFTHCVTSPPYLNSFDYSDIYRPELFLGRFVKSNDELRAIRLSAIRSHVQAKWDQPKSDDFGRLYQGCIGDLRDSESLWDKRLPSMVQAYFEDMESLLRSLLTRAAGGAQVWFVVSTSAYAGVEIPVDLILAEIATRLGWRLKGVKVFRDLRSSSQLHTFGGRSEQRRLLLRESAVVLEKR